MNTIKLFTVAGVLSTSITLPVIAVAEGIEFTGYARYGAHYQAGDNRYVEIGSTGRSVGRLGNEGNGGEFQLSRTFKSEAGPIWNLTVMVDHWANDQWSSPGGIDLKKAYAGAKNIIKSQPEMYFWAGRDFHQRPQHSLNDYFWMTHDGQGGGFKNLNLDMAKFDLGFVGQVDYGDGGSLGNDTGVYAVTTKLHDISLGSGKLGIYVNYGFASDEAADPAKQDEKAWQLGFKYAIDNNNKAVVRYSDGADDSVFDLSGDEQVIYASLEGGYNYGNPFALDYQVTYKEFAGEDVEGKNEYSVIMRPMYSWNDVHSTWLEAGYVMEDFDNGGEKTAWKTTISQNISLGGMPWSRPMLRFYVTVGDVKDKQDIKTDTVSIGAMFESWW